MPEYVFFVHFPDGYIFRQIFELYYKLQMDNVQMYFKENSITIIKARPGDHSLVSKIVFDTNQLLEYYLNEKEASISAIDSSDGETCHIEDIDVEGFKDVLKEAQKQGKIKLFRIVGEDAIRIQICGTKNTENDNEVTLRCGNPIIDNIDLKGFKQPLNKPNCRILLCSFCAAISGTSKISESQQTKISVYEHGLKMGAVSSVGTIDRVNKWGDTTETDVQPHFIKVDNKIMKALVKLTSLCPNGIILVYAERDKVLRLIHKISYFAEHAIYLLERSKQPQKQNDVQTS